MGFWLPGQAMLEEGERKNREKLPFHLLFILLPWPRMEKVSPVRDLPTHCAARLCEKPSSLHLWATL